MCSAAILAGFEPAVRDSDVFTATSAKCGQTWLTTLLYHLKTEGLSPDFGGVGLLGRVPWLEHPKDFASQEPYPVASRLAQIEAMEDPRVFKMHVLWEEVPRPPGSQAKVLTITRDPRDVPYSMYRHLCALREGPFTESGPPPFEVYFEQWLERGYYFEHTVSFWAQRNDPDLLWLRYEDLIADLAGAAGQIVDFLGWDCSQESIDRAVPLATFGHMHKTERSTLLKGQTSFADGTHFVREGGVGKNRARLSAEMEQRILDRARETFEPDCFAWVVAQGTSPSD
ncbi:MAG: sulfotransferase domain-containing protein [Proteobacteria bacterium]|nr:sulfotransferase domain-containing protein [Pseudomonadota bacterium]